VDAACIRNASIDQHKGNDLEVVGPFDRYLEDAADFKTCVQDATVRQLFDVRDGISEGLADELGIKSSFVKSMISIWLDEMVSVRWLGFCIIANQTVGCLSRS